MFVVWVAGKRCSTWMSGKTTNKWEITELLQTCRGIVCELTIIHVISFLLLLPVFCVRFALLFITSSHVQYSIPHRGIQYSGHESSHKSAVTSAVFLALKSGYSVARDWLWNELLVLESRGHFIVMSKVNVCSKSLLKRFWNKWSGGRTRGEKRLKLCCVTVDTLT